MVSNDYFHWAFENPWIPPSQHRVIVEKLVEYELIETSNKYDKPTKSGRPTDIYINLRNARNSPQALRWLAEVFAAPLRMSGANRFVEVPDSVSCIAGPLAVNTGIPYITVRGEAKEGRVSKAKVIGTPNRGDNVIIIDDVITDGASKLSPYQECLDMNLSVLALVVLVDREQGWQNDFAARGIKAPVWPGMTLHDVRRELITMGHMPRCDSAMETANPIIVALDGMTWEQMHALVDPLRTTGCVLKVGDAIINYGAERLLPMLSVYGRIMVDIKGHDIDNTVANICKRLRPHSPWAVTVHASGGADMVKVARDNLPPATKVLAVTVLTSFTKDTCDEIFHRRPIEQVKHLAEVAHRGGADGFVCSAEEVGVLKAMYPDATLVVPGTRSPGVATNDQKRTGTPREAMDAGASYLVMGRQITGHDNPKDEVIRVLNQELSMTL